MPFHGKLFCRKKLLPWQDRQKIRILSVQYSVRGSGNDANTFGWIGRKAETWGGGRLLRPHQNLLRFRQLAIEGELLCFGARDE